MTFDNLIITWNILHVRMMRLFQLQNFLFQSEYTEARLFKYLYEIIYIHICSLRCQAAIHKENWFVHFTKCGLTQRNDCVIWRLKNFLRWPNEFHLVIPTIKQTLK